MGKINLDDIIETSLELIAATLALITGLCIPVAVVAGCVILCKMAFGG